MLLKYFLVSDSTCPTVCEQLVVAWFTGNQRKELLGGGAEQLGDFAGSGRVLLRCGTPEGVSCVPSLSLSWPCCTRTPGTN